MGGSVVDLVEGHVGHVGQTPVEHVLCELVVVFEEDALVVESDGLVELAGEVVDEGQGEVGVGVLAVVLQTLGLVVDGLFVVLQFPVGLPQVIQDLLLMRGTVPIPGCTPPCCGPRVAGPVGSGSWPRSSSSGGRRHCRVRCR